jgi:hypothetical protein
MGALAEEGMPLAKIIKQAQDLANQTKQCIDAKAAKSRSQSRGRNLPLERSNLLVGNHYQPRRGQDLRPKLETYRRNRDARKPSMSTWPSIGTIWSPYSAFAHRLRQVIWPDKFRPGPIEKYDGTTNPKEWI